MPDSLVPAPLPGLIAAFRFAEGAAARLDSDAAAAAVAQGEAGLWLHFDLIDVRAQGFLRDFARLPEGARAVLLERDASVHLDATEAALSGTLPDFTHETDDDAAELALLHFALTRDLLVTARRHPLHALHQVAREMPAQCPVTCLAAILRCTAEQLGRAQAALGKRLGHYEDQLLHDLGELGRGDLADIRRAALRLTRQFSPAAQLLADLREDSPAWLEPVAAPLLRESRRLGAALRGLEAVQERGRIAQDMLVSLVAEETNRRLFLLSVLSAVVLPATLISGIFGMNVGAVPGVEQPWGFAMAMALIGGSMLLVLGVLRLLRLL